MGFSQDKPERVFDSTTLADARSLHEEVKTNFYASLQPPISSMGLYDNFQEQLRAAKAAYFLGSRAE